MKTRAHFIGLGVDIEACRVGVDRNLTEEHPTVRAVYVGAEATKGVPYRFAQK
jgi:hypothetical protein